MRPRFGVEDIVHRDILENFLITYRTSTLVLLRPSPSADRAMSPGYATFVRAERSTFCSWPFVKGRSRSTTFSSYWRHFWKRDSIWMKPSIWRRSASHVSSLPSMSDILYTVTGGASHCTAPSRCGTPKFAHRRATGVSRPGTPIPYRIRSYLVVLRRYPTRSTSRLPPRSAVGRPILSNCPGMGTGRPPRSMCDRLSPDVTMGTVGCTPAVYGGILPLEKIEE